MPIFKPSSSRKSTRSARILPFTFIIGRGQLPAPKGFLLFTDETSERFLHPEGRRKLRFLESRGMLSGFSRAFVQRDASLGAGLSGDVSMQMYKRTGNLSVIFPPQNVIE